MLSKFLFILLCSVVTTSFALADVIVVSKQNPFIKNISRDWLKKVYLGVNTKWPDDKTIDPIISDLNDVPLFLKSVLNLDKRKYLSYWRKRLFSGRGFPPKVIEKQSDALEYIKNHPEAILVVKKKPSQEDHKEVFSLDLSL